MTVEKPTFVDESVAPPAYDSVTPSSAPAAPSSSLNSKPLGPPPIAHSNFLTIEQLYARIDGMYVVDQQQRLFEGHLAPMRKEEEEARQRANLRLACPHLGIMAEVWVLNSQPEVKTWLVFDAPYASSDIRIYDLGNAPSKIEVTATHAEVRLQLPRDYVGLFTIKRYDGSAPPLPLDTTTTLSDVDGVLKLFVGDISLLCDEQRTYNSVDVDVTHGKLKLQFGELLRGRSQGPSRSLRSTPTKGANESW